MLDWIGLDWIGSGSLSAFQDGAREGGEGLQGGREEIKE